jgi:Ala-tRNA(Pro) deacylase
MIIRDYLQSRHVWFETLLHCPAPTATKMAHCVHVPGRSVAKAVLIKTGGSYALAVLPSTSRIDLGRLSQVLEGQDIRLATEDEAEQVFGDCERGALPPFGRLYGMRTVVETSLAGNPEIVFVANLRHEGVRMRYTDYETVEAPIQARFATPSHRQAS